MSRQVKTSQGNTTGPKNTAPQSSQSIPHTSQSATKSTHSMPQSAQSMPHGSQSLPRGPPSMPRGPQSMHDAYSMPYGGYDAYSMPPHGTYPMGYGAPPPMSHGGFPMSPDPQSMPRGMYPMYGGPVSSSMSQEENKNRMKTFSKTQRDTLSREGVKSGSSHHRGSTPESMNRMTMDYQGRFIDSRGRVVDYSNNMDSSDGLRDRRYMFARDMPREEQVMYDYRMPEYMYGSLMENPEMMIDMEMQGRYMPFYDQYADDDYNDGMVSYMDGYNSDFPGMHFPESRTMDSAGRYGDSFER